ncbi:hypothetical protein ACFLYA_01735, partial [Candidatus Dependentiae bacterium]
KADPYDIVTLLIGIGADKILQEDIFLRTNPLNKRSLLDNALFLTDKNYCYGNWIFGASLFYDQTTRMYYSRNSSKIACYLDLTKQTLMDLIREKEDIIKGLFPDFEFDKIVRGVSVIKCAATQERRAGIFFNFMGELKRINFKFQLPFYYLERNFFLTERERKAIENEFGKSDPKEAFKFARRHLISDRIGFGDLRFSFDFPVSSCRREMSIRAGMFGTIPTAFAFKKGLYGREFKPITCRPKISFEQLFELAANGKGDEAFEIAQDFFLKALDGLSSMLINTDLGNERHFGLGGLLDIQVPLCYMLKRYWAEKTYIKNRISLEYLFPARECRWFIEKYDPSIFDRDYDDEFKAKENLAFLERMFVDKFFPYVYETKVSPGFVFWWVSKLAYETERWGLDLGWDVWVRTREKFSDICAPANQLCLLDVEKSRRPWAYQWNILGSLFFKVKRCESDLYISLNGEKTISSRGIGKPFKVTLGFERNF